MLMLAFLACDVADRCRRVEIGPVPAVMCEMRGQLGVIEWLAAHPGWRLVGGWGCIAPGKSV